MSRPQVRLSLPFTVFHRPFTALSPSVRSSADSLRHHRREPACQGAQVPALLRGVRQQDLQRAAGEQVRRCFRCCSLPVQPPRTLVIAAACSTNATSTDRSPSGSMVITARPPPSRSARRTSLITLLSILLILSLLLLPLPPSPPRCNTGTAVRALASFQARLPSRRRCEESLPFHCLAMRFPHLLKLGHFSTSYPASSGRRCTT